MFNTELPAASRCPTLRPAEVLALLLSDPGFQNGGSRGHLARSRLEGIRSMKRLILGLCLFAFGCDGEVPGLSTSPSSTTGGAALTQAAKRREPSLPWLVGRGRNCRSPPPYHRRSVDRRGRGYASWTVHGDVSRTGHAFRRGRQWENSHSSRPMAPGSSQRSPGSLLRRAWRGLSQFKKLPPLQAGTGRFEDATGSFTIDRLLNQVTHVSSGSFSGTI